jgi:integrase
MQKSETIERTWIDKFTEKLQRKGNDASTIERTRLELQRLKNTYRVDLETATRNQLINHLTTYQQNHRPSGYRLHVIDIRHALKFLNRKSLAEEIELPKRSDPAQTIQTLTPEEQHNLIQNAPTPTSRLAFELLTEIGGRRAEINSIRIKDVQFDEYSGIIRLEGKTGVRRRRIYEAVPDLRAYLNNHPHKDDPDSALLVKEEGTPYSNHGFYSMIRRLGWKILHKQISPKMFRHTLATRDSRYYTDRELMKLYGWSSPAMVAVYSHLSMRDVEEKDLVLHGKKRKEEILRPITQALKCASCEELNSPIAIYCVKCGQILANQTRPKDLWISLLQAAEKDPDGLREFMKFIKRSTIKTTK